MGALLLSSERSTRFLDLLFLYFNFLLDGENFLFQLLLFGIVAPVSYTHLDVYKRQH